MRIVLHLTGLPAYVAGKNRLEIGFPGGDGASVGDALGRIEEYMTETSGGEGLSRQDLAEGYMVFLRRSGITKSVAILRGRDTVLEDGDELILIHRFTGG